MSADSGGGQAAPPWWPPAVGGPAAASSPEQENVAVSPGDGNLEGECPENAKETTEVLEKDVPDPDLPVGQQGGRRNEGRRLPATLTYAEAVQRNREAGECDLEQSQTPPGNPNLDPEIPNTNADKLQSRQGKPVVRIGEDEWNRLSEKEVRMTLIGRFVRDRPSLDVIRAKFASNFRLAGSVQIGLLNAKNILLRFSSEIDCNLVLAKGQAVIEGQQIRFMRWKPDWNARRDLPFAPVWITLPRLPIHLFDVQILKRICSPIGILLAIDAPTAKRSRPSTARARVEVNILKPKIDRIWIEIGKGEGNGFWQQIGYEFVPKFCTRCMRIGHGLVECRRGRSRREDETKNLEEEVVVEDGRKGGAVTATAAKLAEVVDDEQEESGRGGDGDRSDIGPDVGSGRGRGGSGLRGSGRGNGGLRGRGGRGFGPDGLGSSREEQGGGLEHSQNVDGLELGYDPNNLDGFDTGEQRENTGEQRENRDGLDQNQNIDGLELGHGPSENVGVRETKNSKGLEESRSSNVGPGKKKTKKKYASNGLGVQTRAMARKGPKTDGAFQFLIAQGKTNSISGESINKGEWAKIEMRINEAQKRKAKVLGGPSEATLQKWASKILNKAADGLIEEIANNVMNEKMEGQGPNGAAQVAETESSNRLGCDGPGSGLIQQHSAMNCTVGREAIKIVDQSEIGKKEGRLGQINIVDRSQQLPSGSRLSMDQAKESKSKALNPQAKAFYFCEENTSARTVPSNKTMEFVHKKEDRTLDQIQLLKSTATSLLGSRELEGLLSPRISSQLHGGDSDSDYEPSGEWSDDEYVEYEDRLESVRGRSGGKGGGRKAAFYEFRYRF